MGLVERWVATRQGFKPRDVEELIDYYWHRPLAGLLVQVIEDWPVTPNQITVASGLVSLFAGTAMGLGGYYGTWWSYVGAALLLFSIVLDCADGQLARIRGVSSTVGRILDGTMDAAAPLAVFHGMAFYLLGAAGEDPWIIWPVGWAAGGSLLWHVQLYDVGKNIYLHASRPDFSLGGDTLLSPERMREMQADYAAEGNRSYALLMGVWIFWTKPQVAQLAPWMQEDRTPANDEERALYNELFTPLMHKLTWLGFGTHLFVLTIAALVAPLDSRAIWVAWAIILGPLNVIAIWYVTVRPRRERAFVERLAAMRAERG